MRKITVSLGPHGHQVVEDDLCGQYVSERDYEELAGRFNILVQRIQEMCSELETDLPGSLNRETAEAYLRDTLKMIGL